LGGSGSLEIRFCPLTPRLVRLSPIQRDPSGPSELSALDTLRGFEMSLAAHPEIQRLTRMHQGTDLELLLLTARPFLTPTEQIEVRELKKRKLQLKDRICWLESVSREHEDPVGA
jgi:hypothetical protein